MPLNDTQTRVYPSGSSREFERDRAEMQQAGWEVESIDSRDPGPGCSLPLIGVLMYRPSQDLVVTYRKRAEDPLSRPR